MAQSSVGFVLHKLDSLLEDETKLLRDVHKEVRIIKEELESIQCFLKNADDRAEMMNDGAKIWVKQVRRVANQIEDVVDEYVFHLEKRPQERGFINYFHKATRFIIKLKLRHQIATQIQDIIKSIHEIRQRAERYGFSSIEQGLSNIANDNKRLDPRLAALFSDDDEVVGIESPRDDLISRLVGKHMEETKRAVISLVGMGGVGKTTLAKKVYDNQIVIENFNCRAWITVSQSYTTEDLLKKMTKKFHESRNEFPPEGMDTMEEISLISNLREYLQDKRYVVFLDDVWNVDFWQYIRFSLPNNNKGSRIIITTRIEDVASSCLESPLDHVHKVQPLPQEKAWELFCKKTFQYDFGGLCPPELEECSLDILKRCEGLPLAIVAIGGLLSKRNKVLSEWKKFYHSLGAELGRNSHLTSMSKILLFSYQDLPHYFKCCFLYMGTIPEDYSIDCQRLIRLWIAEDFVQAQMGKTLEEIAEEYVTELIHRSLIQASSLHYDGTASACRVHDLVREIILLKSQELSFCRVMTKENTSLDGETRRLAVHDGVDYVGETTIKFPIRSILHFSASDHTSVSLMRRLIENFKFLKVLDIQGASLDYLPEEVGHLFNLRYLSVRYTKIKIIPKSIGKLHNLLTLDLRNSLVHELPIEFKRLHKLRHLLCYRKCQEVDLTYTTTRGVKIQKGIRCLKELQQLYHVEANHDSSIDLVLELENLTELRDLGIIKLRRESGRALCASIEKMEHLQYLYIKSTSEDEILDIQSITPPPQHLQRLILYGRLEKLPDWIPNHQNLITLELGSSGLMNDPIKALQALPNLLRLTLSQGYDGEQLHFEAGGFQKLKKLRLRDLNKLNSLVIEKGTLPLLEELAIGRSPQLKKVPSGIYHLNKLIVLNFFDMPEEFLDRIEPDKGKLDHWIVKHVPLVQLLFKVRGEEYIGYKLGERPSK